ncbi:MAG TPA: hypothetical protein VJT82_11325, partial [Pyrinomonadaceae bacterium]|nr:hypothetical protein [Pyrinomonadaceae bacterium]
AARTDIEGESAYVRGDLFCVDNYVHFLLFSDTVEESERVRAGIVYEGDTEDALEKLDAFCRSIGEILEGVRGSVGGNGAGNVAGVSGATLDGGWRRREPRVAECFRRFAAEASATPTNARGEMVEGWLRTAGMLEDSESRAFLRRLTEAHREGRIASGVSAGGESVPEALLGKLAEVGLLKREILVSCRKDGRALFRLPSPDAFSILTGSNAVCNECGAAIADEKAEEVTVPTSLAATLLQDASWLGTHLRSILSKLGVDEKQIVSHAPNGESEVRLMANVCGEAFLFHLRDGDWTTAQARRALDEHAKSDCSHLVLIATGRIQDDARLRLREHARRRTQTGRELELLLVEGMDAIAAELQPAFERVAAHALSEELWELDTSLGLNAGQLVATRFRLMHSPGALRDLAASAAASMTGSLREF